jgi:hypothetical protein
MRGINHRFVNDLKDGALKDIYAFVKQNHDLCLAIRKDYINIYYKGGNLLRIRQNKKDYSFEFDADYCLHKDDDKHFEYFSNIARRDLNAWVKSFPLMMSEMDAWLKKHPKPERQYQHKLLRDNVGPESDIFIFDIEFAVRNHEKKLFKPDMLGLQKINKGYRLIIFENKYGAGAIGGKAGIAKHYRDFVDLLDYKNSREDLLGSVVNIVNNKADLGLSPIRITRDEIVEEYILFLFADFNVRSATIKNAIADLTETKPAGSIFIEINETALDFKRVKNLWN